MDKNSIFFSPHVQWRIACSMEENNMTVLQKKIKNRITNKSRNSPSDYLSKRTEIRDLNRWLYTHVHSSIIDTSQKGESNPSIY